MMRARTESTVETQRRRVRDPKRTLILRLRRMVKVTRRFSVRPDPEDPYGEITTCKECGHEERVHINTTPAMMAKLIKYRNHGDGVSGVCPACSKRAAEERYPLPASQSQR